MTAFHFPLQRVLDWRRTQLELEQARYRQQVAALAALDRRRDAAEAEGMRAELDIRQSTSVPGHELEALSGFRSRVKTGQARLAKLREQAGKELAERHKSMLEARRRADLLDRLSDRQRQEWSARSARELEELAGDAFLAQWNRRAHE